MQKKTEKPVGFINAKQREEADEIRQENEGCLNANNYDNGVNAHITSVAILLRIQEMERRG